MKRRDIIAIYLGAALLIAGVLGSIFPPTGEHASSSAPRPEPMIATVPVTAITRVDSTSTPSQSPAAMPPKAAPVLAAVAEKTGPDGKEVLTPDSHESLPPVGELIGNRPGMANLGPGNPSTEFLNKKTNQDPLLDPPSSQNTGGPVVSPETR